MPAKPVQVSIDIDLLDRLDADPEVQSRGRSAVVRIALEQYLAARERRRIDAAIAAAYGGGKADDLLEEAAPLLDLQQWSDD